MKKKGVVKFELKKNRSFSRISPKTIYINNQYLIKK